VRYIGTLALGASILLVGCGLIAGLSDHHLDARGPDGGVDGALSFPDAPSVDASGDASCSDDVQKDRQNCGSCGRSCLGGDCVAGACQAVLGAESSVPGTLPLQIAVINEQVYWIEAKQPSVFSGPPTSKPISLDANGGTPVGLVPIGSRLLLAFDGKRDVSVLEPSSQALSGVGAIPSRATTIGLRSYGPERAVSVGTDASAFRWIETFTVRDGIVVRSNDKGGFGGSLDALYAGPGRIAIYESDPLKRLSLVDEASLQPSPIVQGLGVRPKAAALGPDALFYSMGGDLQRVSVAGGGATQLATGWTSDATSLAVDGPYIYVTRQGADVLRCLQTGCGNAVTLFQGSAAQALAVGERAIYWAGTKDGKSGVWLVAK
jgi:hypothetical protein